MKLKILFLLLFVSSFWTVKAQQYPVDCRISITPPYANRFYDYQNSSQRFKVSLLLRDNTKPSLDVVLQIRLKGPGFMIENPIDFYTGQSITLYPGQTKTLSGFDLNDNFNPSNLETFGIELSDLFAGVGLPPGPYEWEVRAIELYRNRQVSNTASFRMNLGLNYPPLLNQPADKASLKPSQPQSLNFSWMPRPTGSLAAQQGVLYTMMIYEVPAGEDANAVVNSGAAPFRVIETGQTNYLYGAFEVPLEVGKTYAWQVQVSDINGQETYINNGYSDVHTFTYGKNVCPQPTNIEVKVAEDGAVSFAWEPVADARSYTLRYKAEGESSYKSEITEQPEYLLLYQPSGKKYEYQLNTTCQYSGSSPYTAWAKFEIPAENEVSPEDTTAYSSDPELAYEPEIFEPDSTQLNPPEPEEPSIDDVLNTPIKIYIPGDSSSTDAPVSLPTTPSSLTTEEIKTLLKTKKPTCSGITASYSCGNHDNTPQYSGSIVAVAAGDEVAMNSLVISIVDIDGSGNGSGKIKIPMFKNAEVGVTLSGIKVAEGGCIVAGRAELSGVDLALLNAQQRAKLDQAYSIFQQATDAIYNNAGAIAETYNTMEELLLGISKKTQAMIDKINAGQTISSKEEKAVEKMKEIAKKNAELLQNEMVKKFGSSGVENFTTLVSNSLESCVCSTSSEPSTPKQGPQVEEMSFGTYPPDCKSCLEEKKRKQEELAKMIKKMQKFLKSDMVCGCFSFSKLRDLLVDDQDCEEIVAKMNQMKTDFKTNLNADITVLEKLEGQVSIGETCIDKFSLEISNNVAMSVTSSPTDEYNEPNREINGNRLDLYHDRTKDDTYLKIGLDNEYQAKLIEKWLFFKENEGVSEEDNESDKLGMLSAKYESGNNGVGTISTGKGDHGGVSYGLYQFASNNGSIDDYIASPEFSQWKDLFKGLNPTTPEFNKAWKKLAKDKPKEFKKSQHSYIYRTHYLVFKENNKSILNLDKYSEVLKDVCWSTAVHHGKNTGVVERALMGKDVSKMTEKEIIIAIYTERGKKDKNGELAYFHSSSKKVQDGIIKRFESELADALSKLK